jgi:CheY-like chemotaxis protein
VRVLIIDDDRFAGQVLHLALESTGWSIEVETDSRRGLARHAEQPYDVVFTDVFMPHTDGMEVVRALGAMPHRPKIVVMSSNPLGRDPDYLELARGLGADLTLAKPFPREALDRVIAALENGAA